MEALFAQKPLLGAPYNTELNAMKKRPLTSKDTRRIRTILKTFLKKRNTAKRQKTKLTRKTQTNWLQRLAVATEQTNAKPVSIKQTLSNGDCFYSSIYRAARERPGLLARLKTCLQLDTQEETAFIQSFRNKVAKTINKRGLQKDNSKDIYDYLKETVALKDGTYDAIMEAYPNWFTAEFGEKGQHLGTKRIFIKRLLTHVTKQGTWVSEIEVRQVVALLNPCRVSINIRTTEAKSLPMTLQGDTILQLYNPSESHYEYFSFEPVKSKSSLHKTQRKKLLMPL